MSTLIGCVMAFERQGSRCSVEDWKDDNGFKNQIRGSSGGTGHLDVK